MIISLLGGILIGAGLFAATIFSIYQSVVKSSWLKYAHILAVLLTLIGAASISLISPFTALLAGISLAIVAVITFLMEKRWNKLLALFQLLFALALVLGLPFNG